MEEKDTSSESILHWLIIHVLGTIFNMRNKYKKKVIACQRKYLSALYKYQIHGNVTCLPLIDIALNFT